MRLINYVKFLAFFTALAVVYINLHMQIIDLAYEGKSKENKIRDIKEQNSIITYSILSLKSANHIGVELLDDDSDMEFVDPDNILKLATPENFIDDGRIRERLTRDEKKKLLFSLSLLQNRFQ